MSRLRRGLAALAAAATLAATLALGAWQWDRAHQKEALQAATDARAAEPPLGNGDLLAAEPATLLHRQVVLTGEWAVRHTVFLDNRQMNGRPGFYVVTPLRLQLPGGRSAAVLVQRGWAPRHFTDRAALPPVDTPAGPVVVRGRLAPPPAKLYEFDTAGQGAIRQNLDLDAFRAETRLPLLPVSVQEAGPPAGGLLREWPLPASGAAKNYGYAFQWWALSALVAFLYVWFQFILPRRRQRAA